MHRARYSPSKKVIQHVSSFFSYQEKQLKQGLQKLSEKIRKKFKNLKNFLKKGVSYVSKVD